MATQDLASGAGDGTQTLMLTRTAWPTMVSTGRGGTQLYRGRDLNYKGAGTSIIQGQGPQLYRGRGTQKYQKYTYVWLKYTIYNRYVCILDILEETSRGGPVAFASIGRGSWR